MNDDDKMAPDDFRRNGCIYCRYYRGMKCHHPKHKIPVDFFIARGPDYLCGPNASLWERREA